MANNHCVHKEPGIGQEWLLNDDDTISPMLAPHLVLGVGESRLSTKRRDQLAERHELLRMHSYGMLFAGLAMEATLLPLYFDSKVWNTEKDAVNAAGVGTSTSNSTSHLTLTDNNSYVDVIRLMQSCVAHIAFFAITFATGCIYSHRICDKMQDMAKSYAFAKFYGWFYVRTALLQGSVNFLSAHLHDPHGTSKWYILILPGMVQAIPILFGLGWPAGWDGRHGVEWTWSVVGKRRADIPWYLLPSRLWLTFLFASILSIGLENLYFYTQRFEQVGLEHGRGICNGAVDNGGGSCSEPTWWSRVAGLGWAITLLSLLPCIIYCIVGRGRPYQRTGNAFMTLVVVWWLQLVLQWLQNPSNAVQIVDVVLPLLTWLLVVLWWHTGVYDGILDNEYVFGSNDLSRGTVMDMRAVQLRQDERDTAEEELLAALDGNEWRLKFLCPTEEATFQWIVGEANNRSMLLICAGITWAAVAIGCVQNLVLDSTAANNIIYSARLCICLIGAILVMLYCSREKYKNALPESVKSFTLCGNVLFLETVYLVAGWLMVLGLILSDPYRASILVGQEGSAPYQEGDSNGFGDVIYRLFVKQSADTDAQLIMVICFAMYFSHRFLWLSTRYSRP